MSAFGDGIAPRFGRRNLDDSCSSLSSASKSGDFDGIWLFDASLRQLNPVRGSSIQKLRNSLLRGRTSIKRNVRGNQIRHEDSPLSFTNPMEGHVVSTDS